MGESRRQVGRASKARGWRRSATRFAPKERHLLENWGKSRSITEAELRVVQPCVRGLSNKEIALILALSGATVRAHLASVFKKLGIESRGQLAHAVFTALEGRTAELADDRARLIEELRVERLALDRERTFLDAVLRQSPIGIVVVEARDHRVVLANDEVVRILGDRPRDLEHYHALLADCHADGRPLSFEERPLAHAITKGGRASAETVRTGRDGKAMVIELDAGPIHDRSGRVTAALGTVTDVTRRRGAEAGLRAAEIRGRDALAQREWFMRAVSRDLCTPAGSLLRMAESLAAESALPRALSAPHVTRTANHIARVARLVWSYLTDLVQLDDLDGGRYVARPQTLDPRALAQGAIRLATRGAKTAGVHLETRLAPGLPLIVADPTHVTRIFQTLLDRAIHVSPPDAKVQVDASEAGDEVRFTVRHGGPPLPADHEKKIFDRDWLATAGARRGFGIGFVVAREMVEHQLGRIWAESKGSETEYHFTLPVS